MAYAIIDPFIANSPSQVLEVFHSKLQADEFLARRIAEGDIDGDWSGCLVEMVGDAVKPGWVDRN